MEDYLVTITNELKETNKKLKEENELLKEEIIKLNKKLQSLNNEKYIQELESTINTLKTELESKRESQELLKKDVEFLRSRFDDFIELFAEYINEDEANKYDINDDKDLIFGVNIDSRFIASASKKAIKNYLTILKCDSIQNFSINDFKPTQKSDIVLLGEVFADYIRLSHISNKDKIYGLVEINTSNNNDIQIKFYGNQDIKESFEKFKKIYSKELNLSEAILQNKPSLS